jgi:ABC-type branched-subunit amino acid transport system ATPase component/branched-subunit amino acid ABC-type transport system permease component
MSEIVVSLLDGLGNGAIFAALALALVVTYRSSGVVNFATGAIALYVAYTYSFLRRGEFLIPIPGFKSTADLGSELGFWPAFAISLLVAAVLGALLYVLVFRPLRAAPAVAKAVASIGVMILIQALLAQRVGTSPVVTGPILPNDSFTLFGEPIRADRVWFAVVIVLLTAGLAAAFRFTRFGLATRASAETERGAFVTGLNPDRIALSNWMIAAVVAGVSGILISPLVPVIPVSYTFFIVPALAAALVGDFTALTPALAAGLAIGMIQSLLVNWQVDYTWLPPTGLAELVPLVLILAVLVVRGRPLPTRGAVILQTLGKAPRPRALVSSTIAGIGAGVAAMFLLDGGYRLGLIVTFIYGIISLSSVVVTGYAGQLSLAQLPLAGVGAFALARIADQWGVPFPIAPLLAAAVAMVLGVVIGLPALRIRGLPVAVVTLALAVALSALWFSNPDWNGGIEGAPVEAPSLFGYEFRTDALSSRISFGLLCLGVLALVAVGVALLRKSRYGAAMLAVRANERSAAAAGINVARTKLASFGLGAFIAGLGGALLAYDQGAAVPASYNAVLGLGIFATAYLAGITSVSGGLLAGVLALGGVFYVFTDRNLDFGTRYAAVSGLLLVLTVIKNPEGLVGPAHEFVERRRQRRASEPDASREPDLHPADRRGRASVPERPDHERPDHERVAVLRLCDVGVRFGSVVAVAGVSLDVREGLIVGLIGPNGAGKTTLIDVISGFTSATGTVEFGGAALDGLPPYRRIRRGLGRTFQGVELYDDLTVEENISVGQTAARHRAESAGGPRPLDELLELLHLGDVRERPVKELSAGYRQLVSVGRALAGRPRLLLLDEPAGGLDNDESLWLGERLRDVRDSGVTVVMVDHDMHLVLGVCDVVHVLDLGVLIASGTPDEVRADPRVTAAYLGATHAPQESAR